MGHPNPSDPMGHPTLSQVSILRSGCTDAEHRLDVAGEATAISPPAALPQPPPVPPWGEEEEEEDTPVTDPERALAAARAVVNEEMEAAVEAEVARLREQVLLLEWHLLEASNPRVTPTPPSHSV